jgi:hypothetical protein
MKKMRHQSQHEIGRNNNDDVIIIISSPGSKYSDLTVTTADRHHASSPCSSVARRKALADALAGVNASLISLWAFYPVDVYKTHLQATHHHRNQNQLLSSRSSSLSIISSIRNKKYRFVLPYLIRFFRGVHIKSGTRGPRTFATFIWNLG